VSHATTPRDTQRRAVPHRIGKAVPVDAFWIVLFFAAMAGLWWVAYKIEPHYASKDGKRFLCTSQEIVEGQPAGRTRETRVLILDDGVLHCARKRGLRRDGGLWALVGKSPSPPKRLQVFVAQELLDGHALPNQLAIRVPAKSRVIPLLDEILAEREIRRAATARGTAAQVPPPDPD
jgi:hypothetical protein